VAFPTVPLAGDGKATAGRGGEGGEDPGVSRRQALELSGGGGYVSAPKKKEVTARLRGKAGGGRGPAEDELQGGQCGEAVAGAPPTRDGGGRWFSRWWMRRQSLSLVRRLCFSSSSSPTGDVTSGFPLVAFFSTL
jgi:hypothetical protein